MLNRNRSVSSKQLIGTSASKRTVSVRQCLVKYVVMQIEFPSEVVVTIKIFRVSFIIRKISYYKPLYLFYKCGNINCFCWIFSKCRNLEINPKMKVSTTRKILTFRKYIRLGNTVGGVRISEMFFI